MLGISIGMSSPAIKVTHISRKINGKLFCIPFSHFVYNKQPVSLFGNSNVARVGFTCLQANAKHLMFCFFGLFQSLKVILIVKAEYKRQVASL